METTTGTPSNTIGSTKKPPPEPRENVRLRGLVVLSFWAVVIVLGLPMWWYTTSIHRARLPLQEMFDWADGKVYSTDFWSMFSDSWNLDLQANLPVAHYYRSTIVDPH